MGLRLVTWLSGPPKPLAPKVGVTAATNLFIWTLANEDRTDCWSQRSEGSPSAFLRRGDRNHADHEFAFANLLLRPLAQTAR